MYDAEPPLTTSESSPITNIVVNPSTATSIHLAEHNLPNQSAWRKNYTHHMHDHSFTVTAVEDYSRPPKGKFHFGKGDSIVVSAAWQFPFKTIVCTNVEAQSVRFRDGRMDVAFPIHPHDPKVRWIGQVIVPSDDRNNPAVGLIGDFPCTMVCLPNENDIVERLSISLGGPQHLKREPSTKKSIAAAVEKKKRKKRRRKEKKDRMLFKAATKIQTKFRQAQAVPRTARQIVAWCNTFVRGKTCSCHATPGTTSAKW